MILSKIDIADLQHAKRLLETPNLAAKISHKIGKPIEKGFEMLPQSATDVIGTATKKSLEAALSCALLTMDDRERQAPANWFHKIAVIGTGALGGAFGLAGLTVELPISTTIMLRSIADIARNEGEKINSPEAKIACLEVFALGGRQGGDDAAESGYYAIRAVLAKAVAEACEYIAERGIVHEGAPALIRFITQVAARFGIPVTEKLVAQSIPIIGAVGGASINTLFIDHFQDVARGHFIIRRLERAYDTDTIRTEYQKLLICSTEG